MLSYFAKLYSKTKEEFYQDVAKNLKEEKRMFIVTANPETFNHGIEDSDFNDLLLNENTTLIPDGIGIVKSAQMLKYPVKERITGVDLASKLLELGSSHHLKIALLGAQEEVLNSLIKVINNNYPNLKIIKYENGYTKDKDKFFTALKSLEPDICLVALGIPAQEKLIYKHLNKFKKGIFVGVGGSFDVLSGTKKRAPKLFQKLNIEWLYRLIKEPKRIKRFYQNNIKFIFKVRKLKKERKAHENSSK